MTFELLIATRYLRARRKQTVISVITFIAILGVAAGVAALVVAMAVSAGQREDIQERLFGAQAHLTIYPTGPERILNYIELTKQIEQVEGVTAAAPHATHAMAIRSQDLTPVMVKGIIPDLEDKISNLSQSMVSGRLADLQQNEGNSIIIGKQLAEMLGAKLGDNLTVMSGTAAGGALGITTNRISLTVVGIYSIGLFEYDSHLVYVPFDRAAYLIGAQGASNVEIKVSDINRSSQIGDAILKKIGPGYTYEDWKTMNKPILQALKLERLGMAIAIGLIVFVAALNIVAMLTMMVLEKTRDIAALMAMGATVAQIRRIFIFQGLIIGVIGTFIGLGLGQLISYFADKYHVITLNPDVYSISYLPFRAELLDSFFIAALAILISFLATLYPSSAAARLQPVEALRYE
jgi:lipoprotein-releasing system permease protein